MEIDEWVRRMGRYLADKQIKENGEMQYYDVYVNVPHAFTRVRVKAESAAHAKRVALEKVRQEDAAFRATFSRWADDQTGKVPYPEKPHDWTAVITGGDIAERSFVEDSDVERALRQDEEE